MSLQARIATLVIGALAIVSGGIIVAVLLLSGETVEEGEPVANPAPAIEPTPESITRAELLAEYAEISPFDESATPEVIDDLASGVCDGLSQGLTTDDLIDSGTDIYGPDATRVMQLLVSYDCPEYLDDFR